MATLPQLEIQPLSIKSRLMYRHAEWDMVYPHRALLCSHSEHSADTGYTNGPSYSGLKASRKGQTGFHMREVSRTGKFRGKRQSRGPGAGMGQWGVTANGSVWEKGRLLCIHSRLLLEKGEEVLDSEHNHLVRIKGKVGSARIIKGCCTWGQGEMQGSHGKQGVCMVLRCLPTRGLLVSRETKPKHTMEKSTNTGPGDQNQHNQERQANTEGCGQDSHHSQSLQRRKP